MEKEKEKEEGKKTLRKETGEKDNKTRLNGININTTTYKIDNPQDLPV